METVTLTNEQQIKQNLIQAAATKKYGLTAQDLQLLYLKYIQSPPGTTYLAVFNANKHFLHQQGCGCG